MLAEENKKFDYQDENGPFSIYPLYNGNVAFNPETRPNLYYPFYVNPNNNLQDDFLKQIYQLTMVGSKSIQQFQKKMESNNVMEMGKRKS